MPTLVPKPLSVRFGFGASGLGTLTWDIPEATAAEILDAAWAAGFRYYDTSPLYGHGLSELRLGRMLRERPRDDFLLSTKVGRYLVPPRGGRVADPGQWVRPLPLDPVLDYSYDGVMRSLEQSASRLGIARFDIVYIHDLDRRNLGGDFDRHYRMAVDGGFRALDELRRAGDIGAVGVGVNEADVAAQLLRDLDLDTVMLAGRYTLLEQPALADLLPEAARRGVDVVAVGVFNSGILIRPDGGSYDYGAAPAALVERAKAIAAVCAEFGVEMPAAAVQFPFGHPAVKAVVVGMSRLKAVAQNRTWFEARIPGELWTRLKARGLLAEDAPTP
jgi:D-threo-aldose 1-dehydrogenase